MGDEYTNEQLMEEIKDIRAEINRLRYIINSLVDIILDDPEYEDIIIPEDVKIHKNPYDWYNT